MNKPPRDGKIVQVILYERREGDRTYGGSVSKAPKKAKTAKVAPTCSAPDGPKQPEIVSEARLEVTGECPQMGPDGKCKGLYYGFTCIKDKCRMHDREAICVHLIGGDYCLKYHRFGCVGPENCATKDDYLSFIRGKDKVEVYQ